MQSRPVSSKKDALPDKPSQSQATRKMSLHSGLMKENNYDVYLKYNETEILGQGSMGHVAKVVRIESKRRSMNASLTNFTDSSTTSDSAVDNPANGAFSANANEHCYALKSIQLDKVTEDFVDELRNEIDILKAMDHPNIVKLHEVFNHRKQIYLILELCDGGDLYTRLPYTEKDSAYIVGKLLSAIKYMHDHLIVHRDLKFENIMFENKDPGAEIKVIDFGLSKKFATDKLGFMREGVGTLYSMAPQVLQGVYDSQADMWSVGVITYMLLCSHRPFFNKQRKVMIDRIMRCDYSFKKNYWDIVSKEAKDFIKKLLVMDPKVRYDAKKAQAHKWMHAEFKAEDRAPTTLLTGRVAHNLKAYKHSSSFKKLALNVIAHRSSSADVVNLRKAFDQIDTSNDGVITAEEFHAALLNKCDYTSEEIHEMFDSIDVNRNGHIMYTEFIAASLEAQGQLEFDRIAEAFDKLDVDNSGLITQENMMELFAGTAVTAEEMKKMIIEADLDKNGEVSFDEFLTLFRSENEASASNLIASLQQFEPDCDDESEPRDDEPELIGIDAVIPGGKHDVK